MDALIHHLEEKQELSPREIQVAASLLLDPAASDEKKARLLEALALKGETPDEIAGFVEAFLEQAVNPHLGLITLDGPTLDVCGTGGDQLDLFNISTTAMFISAAAGAIVVKHGNRGITSKSGGADVLEALGVRIDLPADEFRNCVEKAGMGFMFSPLYHPAFKAVIGVRKMLAAKGVKTIFNLIGPLLNPARPQCQLIDRSWIVDSDVHVEHELLEKPSVEARPDGEAPSTVVGLCIDTRCGRDLIREAVGEFDFSRVGEGVA